MEGILGVVMDVLTKMWTRIFSAFYLANIIFSLLATKYLTCFFHTYFTLCSSFCQKEFGLRHKYSNLYIFQTWWLKPLIFQIKFNWYKRIHSLKYLWSIRNWRNRKSEFVTKTQFLCYFSKFDLCAIKLVEIFII